MSSEIMNRYKLVFEYDGTEFSGWQKQPVVRTIEGEIEKKFSQLFQFDVDITGQGRTDAGVHARAQVAHVDLPPVFSCEKIMHAMKGLLPEDIALQSISPVHDKFHARFDATARRYRYNISLGKFPIRRRFSWEVAGRPDPELLQELAKSIKGTHDFINFCVPSPEKYKTTLCTVTQSRWEMGKHGLVYTVEANRFLRHMVRRLTGMMINVSVGRAKIEMFKSLLDSAKRNEKAFSAPPHGLILENVLY